MRFIVPMFFSLCHVMVSATVCLLGSGMIGYSMGFLMDSVRSGQGVAVEAPEAVKK